MKDQSKTFNGIISNLKDTIGITFTEFAESSGLFDFVKAKADQFRVTLEKVSNLVITFSKAFRNDDMAEGAKEAAKGFEMIGFSTEKAQELGGKFKEKLRDMWTFVRNLQAEFEQFKNKGTDAFNNLIQRVKEFTKGESFQTFKNIIMGIVDSIKNFELGQLEGLKSTFNDIGKTVKESFLPAWNDFIKALGLADADTGGFAEKVKSFAQILGVVLGKVVQVSVELLALSLKISTFFINAWKFAGDAIASFKDLVSEKVSEVKNFFTDLGNFILAIPDKIAIFKDRTIEFFQQLPSAMLEALGMMLAHIVSFVVTAPERLNEFKDLATQKIREWFDNTVSFIASLPGKFSEMWESIKVKIPEVWDNIKTNIINKSTEAKDSAISIFNQIRAFFTDTLPARVNDGVNSIKATIASIPGAVKSALNGTADSFERGINNIIKGYNKAAEKLPGLSALPNISIPHLARGTNNFKGGLAIINEQGPELVNLPKGAQVTPAQETKELLQSRSTVVNFNVNIPMMGGDAQSKRRVAEELWDELMRIASANGGDLSKIGLK